MKRCLIVSCSETKVDTPGEIPAIQRYDGPTFRVVRRFLTENSPTNLLDELDVFVISAEFGLIPGNQPIPVYDHLMTKERAEALRPKVLEKFEQEIVQQEYAELFLSVGKIYLLTLVGFESLLPPTTRVIVSGVTSGRKLTELKSWLRGNEASQIAPPLSKTKQKRSTQSRVNGPIKIRGIELALTPDQALEKARQVLAAGSGQSDSFKDWYVLIDGVKVAPKWLVSQLTGLLVRDFEASEARRVLQAVGLDTHRVNG